MDNDNIYRHSTKLLYFYLLIFISVILLFIFNSCATENNFSGEGYGDKINLSIIYCNRQNSNAGIEKNKVGNYIYDALRDADDTQISFVRCDGTPTLERSIDVEGHENEWTGSKDGSSTNVKNFNKRHTQEMIEYLKNDFNAMEEETDVISALSLANSKFKNTDSEKDNIVIICDSGISTKGILNFQNISNQDINPVDYISTLNFPKLNKIDKLIWLGFNECDNATQKPIQATLEEQTKQKLEEKLKNSGIKEIEWDNCEKNKKDKNNLPKVSGVVFRSIEEAIYNLEIGQKNYVDIPDSIIQFKADSTEFVNDATAEEVLLNITEMLKKNAGMNIIVRGYVAVKDYDSSNLSQKRADKVKNKLLEQGSEANQVQAVGMGKGPYPYLKEDGRVNEQNRFIRIEKL